MQHTKGPWKVEKIPGKPFLVNGNIHEDEQGECCQNVAEVYGYSVADCKANAVLIANAPNMLLALKELLDLTKRKDEFSSEQSLRLLIQEIAESVIAQAEGTNESKKHW